MGSTKVFHTAAPNSLLSARACLVPLVDTTMTEDSDAKVTQLREIFGFFEQVCWCRAVFQGHTASWVYTRQGPSPTPKSVCALTGAWCLWDGYTTTKHCDISHSETLTFWCGRALLTLLSPAASCLWHHIERMQASCHLRAFMCVCRMASWI